MKLSSPFIISARLLPALKVGSATISIEHISRNSEGRDCYEYHIDTPDFEYSGNNLRTGCQGGGYQEAMESLLTYLSSAAESYHYQISHPNEKDDDEDLFPDHVMKWCYMNSQEIECISLDLEDAGKLIEE